jgi:hypothetical protein
MARNGNVNIRDLENFRQKLEDNLGEDQINLFIESCAKELAARLLAKVIRRTPVGQYPRGSGKVGGTLRRGWTNGRNEPASTYVNSLTVNHFGDVYVIEIINPVEYAPYVEYGHRTRGGEGWVEGKFMLTISEQEIQSDAPRIIENKLRRKLGECFR